MDQKTTICTLFEEQVKQTPNHTAIYLHERQISYDVLINMLINTQDIYRRRDCL